MAAARTGNKPVLRLPQQQGQKGKVEVEEHGRGKAVLPPQTAAQAAVGGPVEVEVPAFQLRATGAHIAEHQRSCFKMLNSGACRFRMARSMR